MIIKTPGLTKENQLATGYLQVWYRNWSLGQLSKRKNYSKGKNKAWMNCEFQILATHTPEHTPSLEKDKRVTLKFG